MSTLNTLFKNIDDTLKTVKFALHDLDNAHPERRHASIRNAIAFGRSVTFAIQKLKSHVENFDDWYTPKQQEMKNTPLFKFLNEVRTDIVHEGKLEIGVGIHIKQFSPLLLEYVPKPPNWRSFFIGDEHGASGWIVDNHGVEEKYYFSIPEDFVKIDLIFTNLPNELQQDNKSANEYCHIYFNYLNELVKEAKEKFL